MVPIIVDIVIVSTRKHVDTTPCEGTFKNTNISFDLSIEWYILADVESAFKAAFSLHDVVRDDEQNPTLDKLIINRTRGVVDASLESLASDSNGLPVLNDMKLYPGPGPLLEALEDYGVFVANVTAMSRIVAPEERQKQGLLGIRLSAN